MNLADLKTLVFRLLGKFTGMQVIVDSKYAIARRIWGGAAMPRCFAAIEVTSQARWLVLAGSTAPPDIEDINVSISVFLIRIAMDKHQCLWIGTDSHASAVYDYFEKT